MSVNLDELAFVYLTVRDMRDAAEAEHKKVLAAYDADMAQLEQAMLAACNELGNVNSINTGSGTIMRSLKERYNCADWDAFNAFVLENKCPELFERRIAQGNMKEFLKESAGEGLPPGVNVFREYKITVRRPQQSIE